MDGFIGRSKELSELETYLHDPKYRACAVTGRRRIGKTTLIKEFIKGKNSMYSRVGGCDPSPLGTVRDSFPSYGSSRR